jgi:nucleoside-diphosphate-sugar epimerase
MRDSTEGMNFEGSARVARKRAVIFGCGYIGSEFARQAILRGWEVTALTRNLQTAADLRDAGVETVVADLARDEWHASIPGAPEMAVNCVSSGGAGLEGYRQSYVDGMKSILGWARRSGAVGTLLYTSSTSVYPQGDGARVDEDSPTAEAPQRGQILLEAEAALRASSGACARWFILRLAGIYGPRRHSLLENVRAGEVPGRGGHRLNLAHRDDICAAIWAAAAAAPTIANEIFNVADDGAALKSEIANWLALRLGVSPPRFTESAAAGRRPVTPDRVIANGKIRRVLGWRPIFPTFREGYENILSR